MGRIGVFYQRELTLSLCCRPHIPATADKGLQKTSYRRGEGGDKSLSHRTLPSHNRDSYKLFYQRRPLSSHHIIHRSTLRLCRDAIECGKKPYIHGGKVWALHCCPAEGDTLTVCCSLPLGGDLPLPLFRKRADHSLFL